MKRLKYLLLPAVMVCAACSQDNGITIKGHVQFTEPDMQMTLYSWNDHVRDTVAVVSLDENNDYTIQAKVDKPGVYFLECGYWETVSLWAEDEDMTIDFRGVDTAKVKIKNPPFVVIKDSPKNAVMNQLNFNSFRNYQNMIAIAQATYKAGFTTPEERQQLSSTLYGTNNEDTDARLRFLISQYPETTSILAAVEQLDPVRDEEEIDGAIATLLAAHPGYQPATEVKEKMDTRRERIRRMMVGQPAPAFSFPSPDGTEYGPESFKGKILLIDFWASWCGPCRAETPNLKKTYAAYKDKGVEFLSVSIDKSEEAWRKALEEEGTTWPQVLAPDAGALITDLYQFGGIPFIILLDADGRIVAKNLRGEAIGKTIDDLLNGIRPEDKARKAVPAAAAASAPAAAAVGMVPATPIKRK